MCPQGVALDIFQTAPFFEFDCTLSGSNDPQILRDSELVIVTAGFPRKPGMSRSDVLEANVRIIDEVTDQILRYAPDAMVLVVSNPVDALTYRVAQRTGWSRSRVFGQAGVLDASRMAAFIARETGFSALDITTLVLGGHGDTMVPVPRFCTINGIPLSHFLPRSASRPSWSAPARVGRRSWPCARTRAPTTPRRRRSPPWSTPSATTVGDCCPASRCWRASTGRLTSPWGCPAS
jgi:malate/lactate dehydrogenase